MSEVKSKNRINSYYAVINTTTLKKTTSTSQIK